MFPEDKNAYIFEERALLLADRNDLVIIRDKLPKEYIEFIRGNIQFDILTLKCSKKNDLVDEILSDENIHLIKKRIKNNYHKNAIMIQAYIPDKKICEVANKLGISVCGIDFFTENHRKSTTNQTCSILGLNTIDSVYISKINDFNSQVIIDFINTHPQIIIKPDIGLGGQAVEFLNNNSNEMHFENIDTPFLIQEYLPSQFEGSIQFFKYLGQWKLIICETFQKEFQFAGFKYPSDNKYSEKLILPAYKLLQHFITTYGDDIPSFGIDFIVSNDQVYFHDINPRNTGVTYIFSLLHRLYGDCLQSNVSCMYLQFKDISPEPYEILRKKFEDAGLTHLSKDNTEGYALLYPGMLKANYLNLLLVSQNNKISKYLEIAYYVINQLYE